MNTDNLTRTPRLTSTAKLPLGTLTLVCATIACGIAQSFDRSGRIVDVLGFHFDNSPQGSASSLGLFPVAFIQYLTCVFPHGGWWHLLPNTTALLVFGAMAEQRIGASRLLLIFFMSSVVGIICHGFIPPLPTAPVAGASLAISGLLGSYCALSCSDRIRSLPAQYTVAAIEFLVFAGVLAWVMTRSIPVQRDRETSLLYHLAPMMVMWIFVRCFVALTSNVGRAPNKGVNPSGGPVGS